MTTTLLVVTVLLLALLALRMIGRLLALGLRLSLLAILGAVLVVSLAPRDGAPPQPGPGVPSPSSAREALR
jgi:hypothetical protein